MKSHIEICPLHQHFLCGHPQDPAWSVGAACVEKNVHRNSLKGKQRYCRLRLPMLTYLWNPCSREFCHNMRAAVALWNE